MKSESRLLEGWTVLVLIICMLLSVAWPIRTAEWTEGLHILYWVAAGSAVAGFFLAKSQFPDVVAHLFSLVYGIAWVALLGANLLPPQFTWREKLMELGIRINEWLWTATHGGTSEDNLIFVLLLALILWLARPRALLGPLIDKTVLLPDPHFVLEPRRRRACHPRRSAHPRLPAAPGAAARRTARAGGSGIVTRLARDRKDRPISDRPRRHTAGCGRLPSTSR